MPARLTVVVPIYNVSAYLESCLESLAKQTMSDLDVVMVDDGSTDESADIAGAFAARDRRFRLVRKANAGLGAARNTGLDASDGELLAFVDGDDVLPRKAYEALVGALDHTGSDFATGNVRRLSSLGTNRAAFLAEVFERERLETHITRFPALVADRLACNKVFRRSFWDRHGFRFPEGVRNEDIPVIMPAHYLATSVDVVAATVYLWRRRERGDLSGTQRRTGARALRHRVAAVDHVSRFLADRQMTEAKYFYDRSVVGNDLRYFLDILDSADADFRDLFLDLANDFLDRADPRVLDQPLAIERLKWHLVRRRAMPQLLEVLRFQDEDLAATPPVRRLGHWYGDYPFRRDRRLRLPRDVYRVEDELGPVVCVEDVRWEGETLRIEGYAYIEGVGAPRRHSQKIDLVALRSGDEPLPLRTTRLRRPGVTADAAQQLVSLDWSGFVATLDASELRRGHRWRAGSWEVAVAIRAGGLLRESREHRPAPLGAAPVAELSADGALVRAGLSRAGKLTVRVQRDPSLVCSYVLDEGVLQLEGEAGAVTGDVIALQVARRDGAATLEYPVHVRRSGGRRRFLARIPLDELAHQVDPSDRAANAEEQGEEVAWDAYLVSDGRRRRLGLDKTAPESSWAVAGGETAVQRTRLGHVSILERSPRPVVTDVGWSPAGVLLLTGSFRAPPGDYDLVVRARRDGQEHAVPLGYDTATGRFMADLSPANVGSPVGAVFLAEGKWDFFARPAGTTRVGTAVALDRAVLASLPLTARTGRHVCHFGVTGYDAPLLVVEPPLADDERGGFRQRRLRTSFYRARRRRPLRDIVLYDCFEGRAYSDSPRALHEELVARRAPFEHLWVVGDAACRPPDSAVPVTRLSKAYYEAYARARYVVGNDYWPREARPRRGQTWLQTWHGAPLKLHGYQLANRPKAVREYRRAVGQADGSWQHLVSPGPAATPILEQAFPFAGVTIESGLPRSDVLLRADRERVAEDVKRRLGIAAGKRVVLYAPTYRDHVRARDGHGLGPLLDLAAFHSALGRDYALLFRKHRLMVGTLPYEADGVLDVSAFPDATELLLAVDVLVTDYSSTIFEFAITSRPIVFFVPDLETYRDEVRGFSIDFETEAPGPLLRTTGEVVDAVRELEPIRADHRDRYQRFVSAHCGLVDGRASARVVDRVFSW